MADLSKFLEYAKSFFLQRAAGYCLIILSSLFVLVPLGDLNTKFDRKCLLYSDVAYELVNDTISGKPHSVLFKIRFGNSSVCEYNIAISAIFSLIYALAMVVVYIFLYIKERGNKATDLGQTAFLVHGIVEVVVAVMMLVSACTISHGFTMLCSDMTDTSAVPVFTIDRCSVAQNHDWRGYDGSNFYVCLAVATAGSWFQFVFWTLQSAFVVWKLWRLNMLPVLPDCMKPGSSA